MNRLTALLVVVFAVAGCTFGRTAAQTQQLQGKLDSHVYNLEPEKIVLELDPLLKDRGYQTRPDPAAWFIDTEWLHDQARGFYSRYEAKAETAGSGKSKITVTRIVQRAAPRRAEKTQPTDATQSNAAQDNTANAPPPGVTNEVERDLELELELLKKVDAAAHGALVG